MKEGFRKHCQPKQNTVFARYIFHQRIQKAGETFEAFLTDLRNLVKDCKYEKPNEMVRDRIVAGITSHEIREKLLTIGDELTMELAIEKVGVCEATQQQLKTMATGHASGNVDALHIPKEERKPNYNRQMDINRQPPRFPETIECRNCGGKHKRRECPAFGQECRKCHKKNHWAKVCRSKGNTVNSIEDDFYSFYIDAIENGNEYPDTAFVNITTSSGNNIRFRVDSGS